MHPSIPASTDIQRVRVDVSGVVQGVGFRPFVFDLATSLRLHGWVINTSNGVTAEVQGPASSIQSFLENLGERAPPLAFILELRHHFLNVEAEEEFEIRPSKKLDRQSALLPPDVCICDDCLRELRDPTDRRFRYPFINCTNCGPRYTIINDIPYDRNKTSMAEFAMCKACRKEYEDPRDRRFHAQPNACFECGPRVWLTDPKGRPIGTEDPMGEAARLLGEGKILALKGLGGFHLAVNAMDSEGVIRLRERKQREAKPLAVMCRDLEEAARHAFLGEEGRALLTSRHRPIVLLPKSPESNLGPEIAPDNADLGIMLPYTPLHVILFDEGPATLVMTSGNVSEEPIAIDNEEAFQRLGSMVDAFLVHDRGILVRNDDSVVRGGTKRTIFIRRSRGYVPLPILLSGDGPSTLGVGGELKNTVCLLKGRLGFLSQHIGDQSNLAAVDAFVDTVARLGRIIDAKPLFLGVDMHPDYATTRWAEAQGIPIERVQHHHAHVAACLAEYREEGPVIGVALDGTGLGTDGAVWGGEVLVADLRSFRREAHLGYVRLPGGDQAARQPWRMAVSYLVDAFGQQWERMCPLALSAVSAERRQAVAHLVSSGAYAPKTSSTGRLFDGVAALCGLFLEARFEAQAAMGLEMAARQGDFDEMTWPVRLCREGTLGCIPPADFIRKVVEELASGVPVPVIAMRFHRSLAAALVDACVDVRGRTGLETVVASGGSMQNGVLSELLTTGLGAEGFRVLVPEKVPPNDGGIALGQAVVARARRLG